MKLLKGIFPVLIFILVAGCSKNDQDTPGQEPSIEFEIVGSETIGTAGGQLKTENFILTVPSGAFHSSYEIVLYSAYDRVTFGENLVSRMFRIEGLPENYEQPLEVRIQYDGTLSNESYLAVGEEVIPPSIGQRTTAFHLRQATDSAGWLAGELPVPESIKKSAQTGTTADGTNFTWYWIGCVSSYTKVYSPGSHFVIRYSPTVVDDSDAADLGLYLEEAYLTYRDILGFSYSGRFLWPVEVVLIPFPWHTDAFGFYSNSHLGNNFAWLEFNSDKISKKSAMKLTAGHEFFHLVQSLYDSRNPVSKARIEPEFFWLHEATAVWAESLFSDDPDYASTIVQEYQMAPFSGIHAGAGGGAQYHGYGMSPLITYLTDRYGIGCLVDIYQSIYENIHPVDAIARNTEEPVNWFEDFFRQYVMCDINVFEISPIFWRTNMHATYEIDDINDLGTTFTDDYPDLSARLYKIVLTDDQIDGDDKIVFRLEGEREGVSEVTVLRYRQGNIEFVANSTGKITVNDIKKDYLDTGWNLFALVTNNRAVPPYEETSSADLHIEVIREQESPDFNLCGFQVEVLGHYHATTPDNEYDYDSDGAYFTNEKYPGSFTENTFTGDYYREYPTFTVSGSLKVVMSETHDLIDSVRWTEQTTSPDFTKTYSFTGTGIPLSYGDLFQVEGENTCDHIVSFSVEQTAPEGLNYSLQSYECEWDSQIYISFSKE